MRPARGCSCDGSGIDAPPRNEETSVALEGSKGVGVKDFWGGSWIAGVGLEEVEDFRPVKVSQIDILNREVTEKNAQTLAENVESCVRAASWRFGGDQVSNKFWDDPLSRQNVVPRQPGVR